MAMKPGTEPAKQTRYNPTAMAIAGSLLLSAILASIMVGSPFQAVRAAYRTLEGQAERPVPTQPSPNEGVLPRDSAVRK